jgi:hypothetical protein
LQLKIKVAIKNVRRCSLVVEWDVANVQIAERYRSPAQNAALVFNSLAWVPSKHRVRMQLPRAAPSIMQSARTDSYPV